MGIFFAENEVNLIALSLELEKAVIDHVIQEEKKIYVTEDGQFPYWIMPRTERALLWFSTYVDFPESMSKSERQLFCNRFNSKSFLPAVHVHKDKLYADYAMTYRDGLIRSQFVRTGRVFAHRVGQISDQLDAVADQGHGEDNDPERDA